MPSRLPSFQSMPAVLGASVAPANRGLRAALLAGALAGTLPAGSALAQATGDDPGSPQPSLESVVVRARRTVDDRFQSTGSTLSVSRQDIEAIGANTVGDILRQVPGLQVTTTPNGGLEIRMRGMGAQNTRILVDGSPLSTQNRNEQLPFDELPADLIERIEIVRAPTAEQEGAAGGTLNIVLRAARAKRETYVWLSDQHVWGRDAVNMYLSQTGPLGAGPAAPTPGQADAAPRPGATWTYFVSLTGGVRNLGSDTRRESSSSGPVPAGSSVDEVARNRSNSWTLTPRITGRLSASDQVIVRGMLTAIDQHGQTSTSGTTFSGGTTSGLSITTPWYYDRRFGQLAVDWTHRFGGAKLETTLLGERGSAGYAFTRDSQTTTGATTTARSTSLVEERIDHTWLASAKLTSIVDGSLWTLGTEVEDRRLDVDSSTVTDGTVTPLDMTARVRRSALWVQDEVTIDSMATTVVAGLRGQAYDTQSTSPAGAIDQRRFFLQPSVNARKQLAEDLQLRANLARVTRVPRVWELLARSVPSNAINGANTPDFLGNAELKPESTLTMDVGLDRRLPDQGQAGINLFVRNQTDVIARRLFLQGGRWTEQPDNVGDAVVWGLESDLRTGLGWLGLGPAWTLTANASLLQSRMRSGDAIGQRIPGQARYLVSATVAKPLRVSGGWYGGGTLSLVGSSDYDQPAANGARIDGGQRAHAQLDLYIGSVIPNLGFWRLNVYNVTDFRRDSRRTIVDANGVVYSDSALQTLTPRIFLTVGTRF